MTPRLAVTKLVERVEFALRRARSQIAQHWFRLCLNELASVLGNISDLAQVEKHLDAAKTYFEYGRTRKKWEAEYVVGPDGKVEQTKKL